MKRHFEMFAAYNQWANGELYRAAEHLSDEEYNRNARAFFGSMNGTLNHILVADRIWMKRFSGTGDHPTTLNAILASQFADLEQLREAEDRRIIDWVAGIDEKALQSEFSYRTITQPMEITQRLGPAVAHFFNHQTHHRGQAHTILSTLGKDPPPLDLLYFFRSENGKAFA